MKCYSRAEALRRRGVKEENIRALLVIRYRRRYRWPIRKELPAASAEGTKNTGLIMLTYNTCRYLVIDLIELEG